MKGVVLAGGLGTRLYPLTKVVNKHLLPVYDRPMIFWPLGKMAQAGVREVLIVVGGKNPGEIMRLVGSGRELGLRRVYYAFQETEGGIADALSLAEEFAGGEPLLVILGDNVFEDDLSEHLKKYPGEGAMVFLKRVPDPERFGVPVIEGDKIVKIIEKPKEPPSPFAVTGIYVYDSQVFQIIKGLEPSERGELEITDVNNAYIKMGKLRWAELRGWWTDAGTFESLFRANELARGGK